MATTDTKLIGKIFIKGIITLKTGLHIGSKDSSLEIGGVDNSIVKTGNGIPFIPGSSLKGKMRSLLAKTEGSPEINEDSEDLKKLFGDSPSKDDRFITRILVRDGHLITDEFEKTFGPKKDRKLDFDFSEIKTENVIVRRTGSAQHPRQMERVPAKANFDLNITLNIFEGDDEMTFLKKIKLAFELLKEDYIGGSGSRGYGNVDLEITDVEKLKINTDEIEKIKENKLIDFFQN